MPRQNPPKGSSIRLTVRSTTPPPPTATAGAASNNNLSSTNSNKKRRFHPPASKANVAQAHQLRLLHQRTKLNVVLAHRHRRSNGNGSDIDIDIDMNEDQWYAHCVSTLYVVDNSNTLGNDGTSKSNSTSTAATVAVNTPLNMALHLRGTCQVEDVEIHTVMNESMSKLPQTTFIHIDPLERVLRKPATSFTMDDVVNNKKPRHEADSQSTRGAVGMTNALRAASIASQMGELRLSTIYPATVTAKPKPNRNQAVVDCWKKDLKKNEHSSDASDSSSSSSPRREKRIDIIADTMAKAKQEAFKIIVKYTILLGGNEIVHLGGLHATTTNYTPHIYTTVGVYGDSEGPRCWMPTLDSAATHHRASHELTINVTARMTDGMTVVGCGEDTGSTQTFLHDLPTTVMNNMATNLLDHDHVKVVQKILEEPTPTPDSPHVIPPDTTPMSAILATTQWKTASWLPIPARSLGFAIGPFRILEDPEYFATDDNDDDDDDEDNEDDEESKVRSHVKGEGIRQAYFCPIFARKLIHVKASMDLLPNTRLDVQPLTKLQTSMLAELDQSVIMTTVGVPNRALSLMRDILAIPAFRAVSYTQIWIPGASHGGSTSGSLHSCPEVLINPFLGGSLMDSRLLPPMGHRLPFHHGGRVLQFLQARNAIRGWITSAIPLGGKDDVGQGYIHTLIESLMMNLYERGHGAHGEGGAQGGVYFTKRFASESGLNSSNIDFLPIQNIEDVELDVVVGSVIGAVPVEDRNNDQLWRSASNGTESHTSAMDELSVRQLLTSDVVNSLERGNDKDRFVPTPSMGWMGSHLSLSFLSSNANSSSDLGCGAVEMMHPNGGLVYRALKGDVVRRIIAGRAGISNFVRLVRAAFIAAHLDDIGEPELKYPPEKRQKPGTTDRTKAKEKEKEKEEITAIKPRFVVCVNELLKKKGLTHTLFTRALQNLAGRVRESQLLGTLVDAERTAIDPRINQPFVDPEGFPNSFIRGSSGLFLRVGVFVEPAKDTGTGLTKGIQLQSYAEPVIPEGGIAYGGPITVRVVENEGQFREFVKDVNADGSRRDWGSLTLHAKPVTLPKDQTAASGIIETSSSVKDMKLATTESKASRPTGGSKPILSAKLTSQGAFSESAIHRAGYQAIELIRLTNLTPLLWMRVDPMGLFDGKISVFQADACLAEMLFHDGDASAQVESLRALAERPLRIQGSVKVTSIYDVKVSELPVRVLADCLRGSAALHSSLPHTPAVRAQAALAIAQWQNNKAPATRNITGSNYWVGIDLLIQYFRERFYNNGMVMPVKFNRVVLKKNDMEVNQSSQNAENSGGSGSKSNDDAYSYLDLFEEGAEREVVLEEADEVEVEEDEEYRVRSAVVTAIACVRAKDGMTPSSSIQFLEAVLEAVDVEMVGNLVSPDEDIYLEKRRRKAEAGKSDGENEEEIQSDDLNDGVVSSMPHISSMLLSDVLLALCHVNVSPALITDPTTGKPVQSSASHPVTKLMEISRRWLDWELYREGIRTEVELETLSGVAGVCHDTIAARAIIALSSMAILRQSTTDRPMQSAKNGVLNPDTLEGKLEEVATASFYAKIFDKRPFHSDVTRAACAQAITCICCAADRFDIPGKMPTGLLFSLEFMLERITDPTTSPGLHHTLAQLMMDACTGKICSLQRVGAIGGRNDLIATASRFFNGPLGASHGGDNGAVAVTTVNPTSYPAASAVNDGARRGLRLLSRAGHPKEAPIDDSLLVRIGKFASDLWRTINGEPMNLSRSSLGRFNGNTGVCAHDGHLRCSLLALWQWCWPRPRGCYAVLLAQYKKICGDVVMKTSKEEEEATNAEEAALSEISRLVTMELDRQMWRGEMANRAYDYYKSGALTVNADASAAEQGIGQPLPPVQRDSAFKAGGWIASAAQQRRALALDGGTAVTKIRLRKSSD